ncbi:hypothetical protein N9W89_06880 [Hellea sp.]|nr:hypothetical protein [Hellea sp.]
MLQGFQQQEKGLERILLCAIAIILALQLHLQFVQKINWDEFYFLSLVYDYQRGDLAKPLQTAHVHFFGWLKYISPNDVTQIIAARVLMWVLQIGTLWFIFKTAREFISRSAALFAVLSFLGFGFIFIHGTSFRADPIAAFLMSWAVYLFTVSRLKLKSLAALSVCLALGALVTIKVIFFAPLFAVLAIWRLFTSDNFKDLLVKFIVCAGVTALLFAVGYILQLSLMPKAALSGSTEMIGNAGKTTLLSDGLFPRAAIIKQHLILGLVSSFMLALGFVFILADFVKPSADKKKLLVLLAMGLPVLSLIFYRNAFPYYFAFIFPTIILWAGVAADRLKKMPLLLALLALFIVANLGIQYKYRLSENNQVQSATLEEIQRVFPDPVHYIDRSSMMPSYPKSGFFMSSWGLQNYVRKGEPVIAQAMRDTVIPVVIENSPEINRTLIKSDRDSQLLAEDQIALRENYIQHWGHIWIAGKTLELSPQAITFNNLVPGQYTVESDGDVTINGKRYAAGDFISLSRGPNSAKSETRQNIVLRWGDNIQAPKVPAPTRPIFTNF